MQRRRRLLHVASLGGADGGVRAGPGLGFWDDLFIHQRSQRVHLDARHHQQRGQLLLPDGVVLLVLGYVLIIVLYPALLSVRGRIVATAATAATAALAPAAAALAPAAAWDT